MVKCLGAAQEGQEGLHWLGRLVSIPDPLREVQFLLNPIFFSAQPVLGFREVVEAVVEDSLQRFCHTGCQTDWFK